MGRNRALRPIEFGLDGGGGRAESGRTGGAGKGAKRKWSESGLDVKEETAHNVKHVFHIEQA
jgi:hypothetical protein